MEEEESIGYSGSAVVSRPSAGFRRSARSFELRGLGRERPIYSALQVGGPGQVADLLGPAVFLDPVPPPGPVTGHTDRPHRGPRLLLPRSFAAATVVPSPSGWERVPSGCGPKGRGEGS